MHFTILVLLRQDFKLPRNWFVKLKENTGSTKNQMEKKEKKIDHSENEMLKMLFISTDIGRQPII